MFPARPKMAVLIRRKFPFSRHRRNGIFSQTQIVRRQNAAHRRAEFQIAGNPDYLVEFGALLDPVETMLNHLLLQLALGLPLAVIIIAGGGYLLVRRALTPVEQITRAAERITQHNLSERLPVAQHRR